MEQMKYLWQLMDRMEHGTERSPQAMEEIESLLKTLDVKKGGSMNCLCIEDDGGESIVISLPNFLSRIGKIRLLMEEANARASAAVETSNAERQRLELDGLQIQSQIESVLSQAVELISTAANTSLGHNISSRIMAVKEGLAHVNDRYEAWVQQCKIICESEKPDLEYNTACQNMQRAMHGLILQSRSAIEAAESADIATQKQLRDAQTAEVRTLMTEIPALEDRLLWLAFSCENNDPEFQATKIKDCVMTIEQFTANIDAKLLDEPPDRHNRLQKLAVHGSLLKSPDILGNVIDYLKCRNTALTVLHDTQNKLEVLKMTICSFVLTDDSKSLTTIHSELHGYNRRLMEKGNVSIPVIFTEYPELYDVDRKCFKAKLANKRLLCDCSIEAKNIDTLLKMVNNTDALLASTQMQSERVMPLADLISKAKKLRQEFYRHAAQYDKHRYKDIFDALDLRINKLESAIKQQEEQHQRDLVLQKERKVEEALGQIFEHCQVQIKLLAGSLNEAKSSDGAPLIDKLKSIKQSGSEVLTRLTSADVLALQLNVRAQTDWTGKLSGLKLNVNNLIAEAEAATKVEPPPAQDLIDEFETACNAILAQFGSIREGLAQVTGAELPAKWNSFAQNYELEQTQMLVEFENLRTMMNKLKGYEYALSKYSQLTQLWRSTQRNVIAKEAMLLTELKMPSSVARRRQSRSPSKEATNFKRSSSYTSASSKNPESVRSSPLTIPVEMLDMLNDDTRLEVMIMSRCYPNLMNDYVPLKADALDCALSRIVNAYPAQVKVTRESAGKYWFGEPGSLWGGKAVLCRYLAPNGVMVRVGGGWLTLLGYMQEHTSSIETPRWVLKRSGGQQQVASRSGTAV